MRIIACFASSLDGRIASGIDPHSRIGSAHDMRHLRAVRDQADAVFCGGETFREYPYVRRGLDETKIMLQCILTRSFNLPPDAPLFQAEPAVPILIFSPASPSEALRSYYPSHVEWVTIGTGNPVSVVLDTLAVKGIKTLLVEGGGHVMSLFLEAKVLQELYLTLCPLFLGSEGAAGLLTGPSFSVAEAPRTELLSLKQVEQEVYLHLKMIYPASF